MRTFITATAVLFLAGCGGTGPAAGESAGEDRSATPTASPPPAASKNSAVPVSDADVEFAYRCRGTLSAAWASKAAMPASEVPDEVHRIDLNASSWWTGEAARRDAAAGWTEAQREQALSGTTRVFPTRAALDEALPTIRECLERTPK